MQTRLFLTALPLIVGTYAAPVAEPAAVSTTIAVAAAPTAMAPALSVQIRPADEDAAEPHEWVVELVNGAAAERALRARDAEPQSYHVDSLDLGKVEQGASARASLCPRCHECKMM